MSCWHRGVDWILSDSLQSTDEGHDHGRHPLPMALADRLQRTLHVEDTVGGKAESQLISCLNLCCIPVSRLTTLPSNDRQLPSPGRLSGHGPSACHSSAPNATLGCPTAQAPSQCGSSGTCDSPNITACHMHTFEAATARLTSSHKAQVRTNEWDLDRDCDLLRAHVTEQMAGVLEPGTWRLIETIQASGALRPCLPTMPLNASFAACQGTDCFVPLTQRVRNDLAWFAGRHPVARCQDAVQDAHPRARPARGINPRDQRCQQPILYTDLCTFCSVEQHAVCEVLSSRLDQR